VEINETSRINERYLNRRSKLQKLVHLAMCTFHIFYFYIAVA
jgi:hypothetical protein